MWILFFVAALFHQPASASEGVTNLLHLEEYRPFYFLMGVPDTKIQISFKTRVLEEHHLYFGYTQLMMWELFQASPFFRDLNYAPDLFYRIPMQDSKDVWLDLGVYEHESNGKGGPLERSWNRSYVRFHTKTNLGEGNPGIVWNIKAWVPYWYTQHNPYILKYKGLWELEVTLVNFLGPFFDVGDLAFRIYPGGSFYLNPFLGGQELTLRTKIRNAKHFPSLVIQIFHGYGENLLDAEDNRFGVRGGIGF